ncbi:CocE/NonD family hydrolase [Caldimonas brevitalea]|uniref:Hydrolase, CocE/NonD family n=1 Tax=Caldimonas brevitalea TaxID=413882 RepID=A0A0G3BPJ0_9BURK|nr:CocE/NonD family hydrolase [Caldimonas brevitalea]AKJ29903.1 hydrolase, CocE/NonD family [Caldimonas brevitalea]
MAKASYLRRRRTALVVGAATALVLAGAAALWRGPLGDAVPLHWRTDLRARLYGLQVDHTLRLRMRDGVELAASLYLPSADLQRRGTVYVRLPYHRLKYGEALNAGLFFARHGYAVLVQDFRGTGDSTGEFLPWRHGTQDGVDTLDWIVRQPWSNGKVGTWGCSALGELQYMLARARHPAHAAMVPMAAGGALGALGSEHAHYGWYEGGVFQLASGFGWFLDSGAARPDVPAPPRLDRSAALRELPVAGLVGRHRPGPNGYPWFVGTPLNDPRWRGLDYVFDDDRFATPALVINTWGDQTIEETLRMAELMRTTTPATAPQHVVIAPGTHCSHEENAASGQFGELDIPGAEQPYREWYLQWFDRWLKGEGQGPAGLPAYLYYVIGEGVWRSADRWPPPEARIEKWHLQSQGHANGRDGDGRLQLTPAEGASGFDEYRYDPLDPVPTLGGSICCTGDPAFRPGPADQRTIESRPDLLVYTSEPLARPLRIAGHLKARLTVSSSAPDTDFVARLVHVWPDGRATTIQEGVLRARYRKGYAAPRPLPLDTPVELTVDMRSIAYRLPAGHRLRLHISSSSFPRLERNLNTGGGNLDQSLPVVARNRVYHGPATPSYLELPVIPDDVADGRKP